MPPDSVSIAELLDGHVPIRGYEAVAIVRRLWYEALASSPESRDLRPSLGEIQITAAGNVYRRSIAGANSQSGGSAAPRTDPVTWLGDILHALLAAGSSEESGDLPPGLRFSVERACRHKFREPGVAVRFPPYRSVDDFLLVLGRFHPWEDARGGQAVFERWRASKELADAQRPSESTVDAESVVPGPSSDPEAFPDDLRQLKALREEAGISLQEITERTKIPRRLLEGLERGDLHEWPRGIYTRAYLRDYASQVGISPEWLVAVVEAYLDRQEEAEPVQRIVAKPARRLGSVSPRLSSDSGAPPERILRPRRTFVFASLAGVTVVAAGLVTLGVAAYLVAFRTPPPGPPPRVSQRGGDELAARAPKADAKAPPSREASPAPTATSGETLRNTGANANVSVAPAQRPRDSQVPPQIDPTAARIRRLRGSIAANAKAIASLEARAERLKGDLEVVSLEEESERLRRQLEEVEAQLEQLRSLNTRLTNSLRALERPN